LNTTQRLLAYLSNVPQSDELSGHRSQKVAISEMRGFNVRLVTFDFNASLEAGIIAQ